MADVDEIKEVVFEIAEMGDLAQAMINQEQKPKAEAQGQGSYVESAFRILCGEKFFHVRFNEFKPKIIIEAYVYRDFFSACGAGLAVTVPTVLCQGNVN